MSQALEFNPILSPSLITGLNRNPRKLRILQYKPSDADSMLPLVVGVYLVNPVTGQFLSQFVTQAAQYASADFTTSGTITQMPTPAPGLAYTLYSFTITGDGAGQVQLVDTAGDVLADAHFPTAGGSAKFGFGPVGTYNTPEESNPGGSNTHYTVFGQTGVHYGFQVIFGGPS